MNRLFQWGSIYTSVIHSLVCIVQYKVMSASVVPFSCGDLTLCKWTGSDPHLSLRENPSIHIHEMVLMLETILLFCIVFFLSLLTRKFSLQKTVQLTGISKISGALALLLKAAVQFILLVWFLCFKIPRPDVFVVQVSVKFLIMCIQSFMNTTHNHYQFRCHVSWLTLALYLCVWLKLEIMLCSGYGAFLTPFLSN